MPISIPAQGLDIVAAQSAGVVLGAINMTAKGLVVVYPDGTNSSVIEALRTFLANPPTRVNPVQLAASNKWAECNMRLAAIPPVPGQGIDPYATIRVRLAQELTVALAAANAAGGLV